MDVAKRAGAARRPAYLRPAFPSSDTGLRRTVPEIILANLWNLTRRYAPELKFLTSCGDSRQSLCRRRQYNSHMEMIWHSPGLETMEEIQEKP